MFSNITFFRKAGAGSIQSSSYLGSLCSCMLNNGLYGLLEGSHGHLKLSPSMLVWDRCLVLLAKSGSGSLEAPSAGGVQGEMAPRWTGDLSGCTSVPNPQDERGPRADRSGCSVPVVPGRASDSTA